MKIDQQEAHASYHTGDETAVAATHTPPRGKALKSFAIKTESIQSAPYQKQVHRPSGHCAGGSSASSGVAPATRPTKLPGSESSEASRQATTKPGWPSQAGRHSAPGDARPRGPPPPAAPRRARPDADPGPTRWPPPPPERGVPSWHPSSSSSRHCISLQCSRTPCEAQGTRGGGASTAGGCMCFGGRVSTRQAPGHLTVLITRARTRANSPAAAAAKRAQLQRFPLPISSPGTARGRI